MKKGAIGCGSLLGLAVVLAITAALWPRTPIPVDVATVERGTVEERVSSAASGEIEPAARAVVRAETVARVLAVNAKAGDRVEAGAVLVRLDDRALAAAAAAARVQREQAEKDVVTAGALQRKGIITDQALSQAVAARDLARANQSVADANLARARVTAPFAGLLARLPVQEGDSVVVGQAVAEVVDDSKLFVRAAFDEVDAVSLAVGAAAQVRLDAFPDRVLPATVDLVDPVVGGDMLGGAGTSALAITGKKDRTVGVRVALEAPPAGTKVFVGMSADVEVVLRNKDGVLRVPSAAILHVKGETFAYVLDGGTLRRRDVETGVSNWEFVEVVHGLAEGDRVLVSLDAEGIRDGARAEPRPLAEAPSGTPHVPGSASR